ncbi:MAG TPA: LPS export ABC transporter periplasmic protein LptC, partial [Kiloniellales bacterium]|nr:LPS export ABC transporter periplasmic protein LptC [Kiloniellales bacterium]
RLPASGRVVMATLAGGEQGRARRRRIRAAAPPRWSGRNSYSNFVALMKVTLPVVAIMLVGLIVFWNKIVPNPRFLAPDFSSLSADFAQNLSMINPRFDGMDNKGRPYHLTASQAQQTDTDANEVKLVQPSGDLTLEDGTWLSLSADQGRYLRQEELLYLVGNVSFFQDEGFEMATPEALVDFRASRATGDQGVTGQGPAGLLDAEGFDFQNEGVDIIFTGKSHLTIYKISQKSKQSEAPGPENVADEVDPEVGLAPDAPPPPPALIQPAVTQ